MKSKTPLTVLRLLILAEVIRLTLALAVADGAEILLSSTLVAVTGGLPALAVAVGIGYLTWDSAHDVERDWVTAVGLLLAVLCLTIVTAVGQMTFFFSEPMKIILTPGFLSDEDHKLGVAFCCVNALAPHILIPLIGRRYGRISRTDMEPTSELDDADRINAEVQAELDRISLMQDQEELLREFSQVDDHDWPEPEPEPTSQPEPQSQPAKANEPKPTASQKKAKANGKEIIFVEDGDQIRAKCLGCGWLSKLADDQSQAKQKGNAHRCKAPA